MTQSDDKKTERERGILTPNDEEWLNGDSENPTDQKRRLGQGLQLAMGDIKKLIETDPEDVSNFAGIGELFDDLEENTELSRSDCAESLIALAFIITNDSIDYSEVVERINWHPRESESPRDSERPKASRPPTYDVSEMLRFRNALSSGLHLGKEYVESSEEVEGSEKVDTEWPLIKSNVKLYKEPSVDNINPENNSIDFEVVKDIYAGLFDTAISTDSISEGKEVDSTIEKEYHTLQQAKDLKQLERSLNRVTTKSDQMDIIPDRRDVAEYISQDIELMVNREVVHRHEILGKGDSFGYEFPAFDHGEAPGPISPPTLGRRLSDSDDDDNTKKSDSE
jgi:hypothetical protein